MGILDYFTPEARRGNREWLDSQNAAISEALRYYLGPTGIPERLGLLAESTPTAGLERAGTESSRMFAPGLSGWDRMAAAGNMLSETAGAGAGLLGMPAAGRAVGDVVEAAAPAVGRFMGSEFGGVPLSGATRGVDDIENVLRTKYPDVNISVSGSPERGFTLNKIDVPKGKRKGGIGTAVMNDLVNLADQQGAVLKLSPSSDFGGSVPRLKDFYARFGFVQNKGKNADYEISESMYRPPSVLPAFTSTDAATRQGSEIINLLRSGRAGEVTEQILDMGDPVLNARLSEYLYSNYDLPMDTASRMGRAQEMGLSQQTYHGTPYADITAMRPSEFGAVGPGVYAAGRPVTASDYSRGYGMMTPKETFEAAGERYTPGGNVMPIQTPQNLQSFEDWTAAKMADMQRQGLYSSGFRADSAASQAAADAGFGGVSARNENVVIFDPANVRSRFARFDPRLSHLRNLNAGIAAGVPIGLLAMQPDQGPQ